VAASVTAGRALRYAGGSARGLLHHHQPHSPRNWPAYNEALKRRGSLTIWFDPEMSWDAAPTGRRGRQQTYSDAAVQKCLTMKVLFGMALRQTTGFVESLLRLRAKASGMPVSMAAPNGASGVRSTLGLMSKLWRSGPSR
jgi:hypothetical protein